MNGAAIITVTQTRLDRLGHLDHVEAVCSRGVRERCCGAPDHTMLLDARTDLSMSSGAIDLVAEFECEPLIHVLHETVQ